MNSIKPDEWFKIGPFTIFDVETTGMSPVNDRIVEIASVRIDQDGSKTRYSTLINPGCTITDKLTEVHGINNEMVKNEKTFKTVGYEFTKFAEKTTLVAHNARFDLSFLQESLARNGIQIWQGKTLDTIPIIKKAFPGLPSYSLQHLRFALGLKNNNGPAHRAFADVEWTLEIFTMSMKRLLSTQSEQN